MAVLGHRRACLRLIGELVAVDDQHLVEPLRHHTRRAQSRNPRADHDSPPPFVHSATSGTGCAARWRQHAALVPQRRRNVARLDDRPLHTCGSCAWDLARPRPAGLMAQGEPAEDDSPTA